MGQFYSQLQANCRGSRKPTRQDPSLNECLISLVNTEYLRNDEAAAEKATALKKAQFMDSLMAISESSQFQSLISFSIESDDYHGVGKTDDVFVVVDCSERQNRIILGNLENGEMNVYEGYDWITGTAESTGVSNVNGKKWEGELRENQPFGYGVLYNENDKREYEGFLYDQMKVGYGIEYNSDTETVLYNGCFYNNQRHGPGVLFNQEGETEYEGLWKEGKVDSPPCDGKDITSLVSNLDIPNNSFLHVETSGFLFWLHSLRNLVIGSECFVQARVFTLDGLSQLEQIVVGEKSFSCGMTERTDGLCRITKCPALKSILFQDCSFADYSSLELESLPSLQSLHLGSCCFLWSPSLVLTSILGCFLANRSSCIGVRHAG